MKKILFLMILINILVCGGELKPFPQEISYKGCIKPSKISQSQMNDDIREYYKYWKEKYIRSTGGKNWYLETSGMGLDGNELTTSEIHGYGMIIFAIMAGEDIKAKYYYDGMYNMYNGHRSKINKNLMAWAVSKDGEAGDAPDSATSGDLNIAYSLLLAEKQWGGYIGEAKKVIQEGIKESETSKTTKRTALGDSDTSRYNTKSSDWATSYFSAFHRATNDYYWLEIRNEVFNIAGEISRSYSYNTGFMPDFVIGSIPRPAGAKFLESVNDGEYFVNASRFPMYMALDFAHNNTLQSKNILDKINNYIKNSTGDNPKEIKAGYKLNGGVIENYSSMSFSAPLIASAIVGQGNQEFLNKGWILLKNSRGSCHDDTLALLSMLIISGNWWVP